VDVIKSARGVDRRVVVWGAGDFFGEIPLLLDVPALASVQARQESHLLRLDEVGFRTLMGCPTLKARILKDWALRLGSLKATVCASPTPRARIIGERQDPVCHDVRLFLDRNHVPIEVIEPAQAAQVTGFSSAEIERMCPFVQFEDHSTLTDLHSYRELAERVKLQTRPHRDRYDVVIVGAGPAGLAAAVYGASEGLSTLVVEKHAPGGQAMTSSRIRNYLGFPAGLSGDELARRASRQAVAFGAEMVVARKVEKLVPGQLGDWHTIGLDGGDPVRSKTVVLATGVQWREHPALTHHPLMGRGIFYGSAPSDAAEAAGHVAMVVGGGNSAGQAVAYLAGRASKVLLVCRGRSLQDSMSQYLIDQIGRLSNVEQIFNTEVQSAEGTDHLERVTLQDKSGKAWQLPVQHLFLMLGGEAHTDWVKAVVTCDEHGYICTGREMLDVVGPKNWSLQRDPFILETSVPGIFAAGDVRHESIKRVASGVGEGSMSIALVHRYLAVSRADRIDLEKSSALGRIPSPAVNARV
jgi:thioredoxin reductase (NADPH)